MWGEASQLLPSRSHLLNAGFQFSAWAGNGRGRLGAECRLGAVKRCSVIKAVQCLVYGVEISPWGELQLLLMPLEGNPSTGHEL